MSFLFTKVASQAWLSSDLSGTKGMYFEKHPLLLLLKFTFTNFSAILLKISKYPHYSRPMASKWASMKIWSMLSKNSTGR
jgi:hypothetical protein